MARFRRPEMKYPMTREAFIEVCQYGMAWAEDIKRRSLANHGMRSCPRCGEGLDLREVCTSPGKCGPRISLS